MGQAARGQDVTGGPWVTARGTRRGAGAVHGLRPPADRMPRPGRHLVGAGHDTDRNPRLDDGAARIGRPHHQAAAELAHALLHAGQTDPEDRRVAVVIRRKHLRAREPAAVVLHRQQDRAQTSARWPLFGHRQPDLHLAAAGVAVRVAERLLRHPEQRGLDVPGDPAARQFRGHLDGDREAAAACKALRIPPQRRGQPHLVEQGRVEEVGERADLPLALLDQRQRLLDRVVRVRREVRRHGADPRGGEARADEESAPCCRATRARSGASHRPAASGACCRGRGAPLRPAVDRSRPARYPGAGRRAR